MPHVRGPPHYLAGCHMCQLLTAQANANPCDGWIIMAANVAAEAAQTAAEAAGLAASAAAQAATAANMSQMDVGFGSNHMDMNYGVYGSNYNAPAPFPAYRTADASCRKVQQGETWHGGAQKWHGRHGEDGYIGSIRGRSYQRRTGGSASKSRHANNRQWYQWKAQQTGNAKSGQGIRGGKVTNGQPRRDPRRWYRPQQPKSKRSNQKQTRFHRGNAGVSRATQTAPEMGTQTVSQDVAFSAVEEIMKGYLEPEPELPQIFLLTGTDSDDDEAGFFPNFLPTCTKSWPSLHDGATTVSSVSSADNFSQDSDEENTIAV